MNRRKKAMQELKRPLTQEEIQALRVKCSDVKGQVKELVHYFNLREDYKRKLRVAINKYGIGSLGKDILDTIPTDLKVLYEIPWYFNIIVLVYIIRIAVIRARNDRFRSVTNGK